MKNWTPDSPLREFYDAEFAPNALARKPQSTLAGFAQMLANLDALLERPPTIRDLTRETFTKLVSAHPRWALRTQRLVECRFRKMLMYAATLSIMPTPTDEFGMNRRKGLCCGPMLWSKRETRKLLRAAKKLGGTIDRKGVPPERRVVSRAAWFRAYVFVARDTGLPMSNILRVRGGDITLAGVLVSRLQRGRRRDAADRAFTLKRRTIRALRRFRGGRSRRILAVCGNSEQWRLWFRELVKAAGIQDKAAGYRLIIGNGSCGKIISKPPELPVLPIGRFSLDSMLGDFVENCYLGQNLSIRSDKTRQHYRALVRDFSKMMLGQAHVRDLTEENVCRFVRWLEEQNGLSPHTIQQRQNYLCAIANWCSKRRLVPWWVNVPRYKTPDVVPQAWKIEEMRQLHAACSKFSGSYFNVAARDWWIGFHYVLWDSGERTGAVLSLECSWLNTETRVLSIPGSARKGGIKAATYTLKPETVEALRPLLAAENRPDHRPQIFAFPGCRATFYGHYGKLLRLAGLPDGRKFKPQRIRRTFATFVELAGGNATEALGHSCRRIAVESYLDPAVLRKPAANLLLPELVKAE